MTRTDVQYIPRDRLHYTCKKNTTAFDKTINYKINKYEYQEVYHDVPVFLMYDTDVDIGPDDSILGPVPEVTP